MIAAKVRDDNAAFLAFCVIVYERSCQKNNPGVVYSQCSYANKLIEVMNEIDRGNDGATGAPLGVALLQALREMPEVETHLVMSKWAKPPLSWKRLTPPGRCCHG